MSDRSRVLLLALLVQAGCGHDFEPPDAGERTREAAAAYSPTLFDTITWESDSVRVLQGNEVYAARCRRCHGSLGEGDGRYASDRGIAVPSLVEAEWSRASMDSVRLRIFAGHESGMPTFGIAGITPREIDSSAFYVLSTLRPEVLEGPGGSEESDR